MSRLSRVLSLFAVPVLFAACSPGSTDTPLSPTGIRRDGGSPLPGGNVTPPDSTTSTTSTTSAGGLDDPAEPDSTTLGGNPLPGGN